MSSSCKHRSLLFIATFLTFAISNGQNSEPQRDRHVEATLISEVEHVQPGQPFRVGLLLKHDAGWHTYWKSSATGYPTSIDWSLPDGFTAGPIIWPTPVTYDFQGWTEYVYEEETLLPVVITPPTSLTGEQVRLSFSAEWLVCKDICIPGGVESSITLPVRDADPDRSSRWAGHFDRLTKELPAEPDSLEIEAIRNNRTVSIRITGSSLPDTAFFFDEQSLIKPESGKGQRNDDSITIELELSEDTSELPERISGVLRAEGGWESEQGAAGIKIDVPVSSAGGADTPTPASLSAGILVLAFFGGLILNLMPCVFPILGIKIMGFVNQAGESRGKIISHGLVFSAGVLVSFWILATLLLVLRSGGSQLGWGFQLQSPGFVLALTLLLFAFALNMSGLYEFGQSAVGVGSNLTAKSGMTGSFFSGVLATVVATPCAAPFLAPALGAALALPPVSSLAVFTFIAIGLSTPYLLLSTFPTMLKWLPKPGPWMETFKQFMSFLLYATVAYLVWVLAGQLTDSGGFGPFALLKVLLSLVLLALGLWIYGRWGAFHLAPKIRWKAIPVAALLMVSSVYTGFSGTEKTADGAQSLNWVKWEPGKAESLAEQGNIVYVDFTARWCVTCQTNKAAVFSSKQVLNLLEAKNVILLKADWTNQDPQISAALERFNRSAVPFNLVYGPALQDPLILPEFLTPGTVVEAIETASGS